MKIDKKKIIQDIIYIITYLIEVLTKHNKINLILQGRREEIAHYLYNFYNFDPSLKHHFLDILKQEINPKSKENLDKMVKHYKRSLQQAVEICEEYDKKDKIEVRGRYFRGSWFRAEFFKPHVFAYRIYVNCKPDKIHVVIKRFLEKFQPNETCPHCDKKYEFHGNTCYHCGKERNDGLAAFKFLNPDVKFILNQIIRTDKIIFYFTNDKKSLKQALTILRGIPHLCDPIPHFVNKVTRGVGWTGEVRRAHREKIQEVYEKKMPSVSFGTFMSAIISKELCDWVKKRGKLPTPKEVTELAHSIYDDEKVYSLVDGTAAEKWDY